MACSVERLLHLECSAAVLESSSSMCTLLSVDTDSNEPDVVYQNALSIAYFGDLTHKRFVPLQSAQPSQHQDVMQRARQALEGSPVLQHLFRLEGQGALAEALSAVLKLDDAEPMAPAPMRPDNFPAEPAPAALGKADSYGLSHSPSERQWTRVMQVPSGGSLVAPLVRASSPAATFRGLLLQFASGRAEQSSEKVEHQCASGLPQKRAGSLWGNIKAFMCMEPCGCADVRNRVSASSEDDARASMCRATGLSSYGSLPNSLTSLKAGPPVGSSAVSSLTACQYPGKVMAMISGVGFGPQSQPLPLLSPSEAASQTLGDKPSSAGRMSSMPELSLVDAQPRSSRCSHCHTLENSSMKRQQLSPTRPPWLTSTLAPSGSGSRVWHEVGVGLLTHPVDREKFLLMVTQTDVTARTHLETVLARLTEAQMDMLSQIFPRHVLDTLLAPVASAAAQQLPASPEQMYSCPDQRHAQPRGCVDDLDIDLAPLARSHASATILFLDVVGFTQMCRSLQPYQVLAFINQFFSILDSLAERHEVQKVDTSGDCYIVAAGVVRRDENGFLEAEGGGQDACKDACNVMAFALDALDAARQVLTPHNGMPVSIRIGLHTGACVSGVVGRKNPKFTILGDTINTASRMESTCVTGGIQVSASTYQLLLQGHQSRPDDWTPTGGVQVKGKGVMETYLWVGHGQLLQPPQQQQQQQDVSSLPASTALTGAPEAWTDMPLPVRANILRIRPHLEGFLGSPALHSRRSGDYASVISGSGMSKRSPFLSLLQAVTDSKTMMAAGSGSGAGSPRAGRCSALDSPVSSLDDLPPRRTPQTTRARTNGGAIDSLSTLSAPPADCRPR